MAILVDAPRWPAHGTLWGHLVSDSSLEELHQFAAEAGLPGRGFDHDHYDFPAARYQALIALGALPTESRELAARLVAAGLRVRNPQRKPKREAVLPLLQADWASLLPAHTNLRDHLLECWSEPHRHYHDTRHLSAAVAALGQIGEGATPRTVRLALWFHDAVYEGVEGSDEERSAELAETELAESGFSSGEAAEVARLVRLTRTHAPEAGDGAGAQVTDADLSILGALPGRYDVYVRDVRLEYAHLDDEAFRSGRAQVVHRLFHSDLLFRTASGRQIWEDAGRANLRREARRWERTVLRLNPASI